MLLFVFSRLLSFLSWTLAMEAPLIRIQCERRHINAYNTLTFSGCQATCSLKSFTVEVFPTNILVQIVARDKILNINHINY